MANKTLLFIGAGVLLLIGVCLFGYGILSVIGSTSAQGNSAWLSYGLGFGFAGVIFLAAGIGLIIKANKQQGSVGSEGNVSLKIDLPASTKIEAMKCKNCGGALKPENIKMAAGAPMVECPYCGTTYQLTEEPKW